MKTPEPAKTRRVRTTLTFRLALVFGPLFALGILAFGGIIYGMTAHELTVRSDVTLHQKAQQLLTVPASRLPEEIAATVARNRHGLNYFALLSRTGERIQGNFGPIPEVRLGRAMDVEASPGHGPMRVLAVATEQGEVILIGRDISEIRSLLHRMILILSVSSVAVIAVVLLLGRILSRGPLRRVQELEVASRQIAAGHFDVRIPTTGRQDEFDRIALSINAMVGDIERILSQVKNVTDSIAHDLRTPLTRVRNRLDEARSGSTSVWRQDDGIDDLIGDLDSVLARFAALLRIAELEASERRAGFGPISVETLLERVQDLYAPLAEDAGIRLELATDPALQVHGDSHLLLEALGNLVDNAIKFAHDTVRLSASQEGGAVIIAVQDDGPGIAEAEREAVLQRFYKTSVGGSRPGFGLGLSIVTAILHIHRFRFDLCDAEPGLLARIITT